MKRRPFWVYWDSKTARVRIHLTDCGACQNGNGMHTDDLELGKAYGWSPRIRIPKLRQSPIKSSLNSEKTGQSTAGYVIHRVISFIR
jgi:hypothetical protein